MNTGNDSHLWRVLGEVLQRIRDGRYPEGWRLPAEAALAAELGVSRATVTRAMWLLRWTGAIVGPTGHPGRVAAEPMRSMALQLVDRAYEIRRLAGDRGLKGADPEFRWECDA